MSRITEQLSPTQREAVTHIDGPLLILAGPGSGKTRVITHRVAYLIEQGVSPDQIVALTFTNKAADEMRQRLMRLMSGDRVNDFVPGSGGRAAGVWMGTFHRFGAYLLRRYAPLVGLRENFSILDMDDSNAVLQLALGDEQDLTLTMTPVDRIRQAISSAKNDLIRPDEYVPRPSDALGSLVAKVYAAYQRRLLDANAVDFDDLLMHPVTVLRENPHLRESLDNQFRYLLVDEYQDTNLAQYALVRSLSVDHPNLAVTGDPDQSIYGWRGANIKNILEYEHDFPDVRVVRLEQNYRSTQAILRVADALIANNFQRKKKALFTENAEGRLVRLTEYGDHRLEAEAIAAYIAQETGAGRRQPRDFAVLYRVNWLSRVFEEKLRQQGIPYQIVQGTAFYERQEIRDTVAYLQLLNNPQNNMALRRIINSPPRGIGKTTLQRLDDYARANRICLLEAARQCGTIPKINARTAVQVARFVAMLDRLGTRVTGTVSDLLAAVLAESGYREHLQASAQHEADNRLENLNELETAANEFDCEYGEEATLEAFLEQVSLVNDVDNLETGVDRVTLMTLHAAKGLEFPIVFIAAMEEGILPHARYAEDPHGTEEERRLLFVGITRACEELHLSHAGRRVLRGATKVGIPSQFLMELPRDEMQLAAVGRPPRFDDDESDFRDASEWEPPAIQLESAPRESTRPTASSVVRTAAELAGEISTKTALSPDVFRKGMLVQHPDYGSGIIEQVQGENEKRTAAVRFLGSNRVRKFVLAHSPLKPVQSR